VLTLTGLDRFVAPSSGAQQQVNRRVEEVMVAYRQDETTRLAQDMPRKDLTVTQDETFTGGLCLVTMDPDSNFIILEQLAQARDQGMWHALMAPALAQLNCQVIQSTSDEAPGLLAYVEHYRLFAIIWAESKSLHNRLISFFSGCVHCAIQRPGVESA
jgi:hypothetical protein